MKVKLYDTTLRDGTQMEGISLSVQDKLRIAQKLDEAGIHYIEGGWPGSNPKDMEFFTKARSLKLKNSVIVPFSSTRRAHTEVAKDPIVAALLKTKAKTCTIFGKTWDLHVKDVEHRIDEDVARLVPAERVVQLLGNETDLAGPARDMLAIANDPFGQALVGTALVAEPGGHALGVAILTTRRCMGASSRRVPDLVGPFDP